MEEDSFWSNLLKYFLHGILLSVISSLLVFAWAFIFAILVLIGLFIGFIIGFIVLFFIMGGLNSFLTDLIWDVAIKTEWRSLFGHGFVLSIALIVVHVAAIVVFWSVPSLTTIIVMTLIYAFVDGFIAKNVAGLWEEEYQE